MQTAVDGFQLSFRTLGLADQLLQHVFPLRHLLTAFQKRGNDGALPQVRETRIVAVPAPCDFRFSPCFFPHSGRMALIPHQKPEVSGAPRLAYCHESKRRFSRPPRGSCPALADEARWNFGHSFALRLLGEELAGIVGVPSDPSVRAFRRGESSTRRLSALPVRFRPRAENFQFK